MRKPHPAPFRLIRPRLAALGGALALGLAAVVFARSGEAAQALFDRLWAIAPWTPLVLTPLLFALVTATTRRHFDAARGSGIPQVMAAAGGHDPATLARGPLVSLRTALAKFAGTIAMLLGGAAVGREGPTVQISAAIMVAVHRALRVPVTSGVIIAGGAAGVAAAFNTPLAGVAFAIEELAAAFEQKLAVLVMLAVLTAGLVSLALSGDYIYFGAMAQSLPAAGAIGASLLAGLCGGAAGGLFARLLIAFAEAHHPWIARLKARPVVFALGCGLVVAATGLASGGISWGTGYGATRQLLAGGGQSLWFGPARFVATVATAVSGAPGGIFAPSLSVGAGLGQALALLFPGESSGAIVMLGMIGYFAGVTRAPLTAVIIVMEMTANRAMILPLFAAALCADQVSAWLCPDKLYHALARPFRARPPKGESAATSAS